MKNSQNSVTTSERKDEYEVICDRMRQGRPASRSARAFVHDDLETILNSGDLQAMQAMVVTLAVVRDRLHFRTGRPTPTRPSMVQ